MNLFIYIWFAIQLFCLGVTAAKHGEEVKANFWATLIGLLISVGLLYFGGAFDNILNN